jgi:transposase
MYVNIIDEKKTGRKCMTVRESFRKNGKVSQRTIKKIGYVDEFTDLYDDPIAHFKEYYKNESKRVKEQKANISISFSPTVKLEEVNRDGIHTNRKSLGASALSVIYHQLEIDKFIYNHSRSNDDEFDANAIMKLLVYSRILFPGSKLSTYNNKGRFFDKMDFSLEDVYRFMDRLIKWQQPLIVHLNAKIKEKYNRDTTLLYYDVTNYYFEVDHNDSDPLEEDNVDPNAIDDRNNLRKKGVSKEHRPNPIIQMGLFMDEEGLPVTYKLFKGNTADCKSLKATMNETRLNLDYTNIIIVGDKGMMSGDNISTIKAQKNGYVISYSVRGASKVFQDYVLDQKGYEFLEIPNKQRYEQTKEILFVAGEEIENAPKLKIKDRETTRIIDVPNLSNPLIKQKVEIHERQIIFYSEKYAKKAKADRVAVLQKAMNIVSKNKKLPKSYGANKYVTENMLTDDGELIEGKDYALLFNNKKVEREEALDGYYVICTNVIGTNLNEKPFEGKSRFTKDGYFQLNKKIAPYDIVKMYRGLWEIEETFRITKSNLELRPVYHSKRRRIEAHFLTCYVSLTIIRLLEKNLNSKYTTREILNSLRKANGSELEENYYIFDFYDEVLKEFDKTIGTDFSYKYRTKDQIRKIFAKTKKT